MAIANLHETIMSFKLRRNQLNLELTELMGRRNLATYAQGDSQSSFNAQKASLREYFKDLYNNDPSLQDLYKSYEEIPDFNEELEKITAMLNDELDELSAWEQQLSDEITVKSTELEEVKVALESYTSMLSSNIQDDFNYGLK